MAEAGECMYKVILGEFHKLIVASTESISPCPQFIIEWYLNVRYFT